MEIPIYCSHSAVIPIEQAVANPRNPNKHPDKQITLLSKIIQRQGWRAPITISKRSGFIVRGHARRMAAEKLGLTTIPADFQNYENEAAEWADMIADNRIAELAEIDNPMLKDLLTDLDTGEMDMDLTGFDENALENLMTQYHPDIVEPGTVWDGKYRGMSSSNKSIINFGRFAAILDIHIVDEAIAKMKSKWGENPDVALAKLCEWIRNEDSI